MHKIIETYITSDARERIKRHFSQHAIKTIGLDGISTPPVLFEIRDNDDWVGACLVQIFYGNLHIKNLIVDERYRNKGFATKLMTCALKYGKKQKCKFAFVETMSFQAPDFYKKLGFKVELKRDGFAKDTSVYYLKKDL